MNRPAPQEQYNSSPRTLRKIRDEQSLKIDSILNMYDVASANRSMNFDDLSVCNASLHDSIGSLSVDAESLRREHQQQFQQQQQQHHHHRQFQQHHHQQVNLRIASTEPYLRKAVAFD